MTQKILIPRLGESVTSATIAKWFKKVGDPVQEDERLVELETDKVTLEINATATGLIKSIKAAEGATVKVGDVIGEIEEGAGANPSPSLPSQKGNKKEKEKAEEEPKEMEAAPKPQPAISETLEKPVTLPQAISSRGPEERVKMTILRRKIAERLKEAQNTAAMLTTFNEIDMTNVMALRTHYQEAFEKKYGVRLGLMSFFTKASICALKEIPVVNAEIEGDDIIYKNHYDIGMAVSTPQGLVVPVVRNADQLSFSGIEKTIIDLSERARAGRLTLSDLSGGTFTITNGGIFGSMLSTPILNPPQSGILGLHKIEKRPVVLEDSIQIRSMMYAALTYDHRIIDGRDAVTFLVRIKECLEHPERLLLGI